MIENFVSDNSDLERDLKPEEFKSKQQQLPLPTYPKLIASVNRYQDTIIFSQEGRDFGIEINGSTVEKLKKILLMMDGTNSLTKLQKIFSPKNPEAINTVVRYLDDNKLVDDASDLKIESGLNALLELEDLTNKLLENQVSTSTENKLRLIEQDLSDFQLKGIYGFAIEIYHFFSRKAHIDSSVLSFTGDSQIRQLINQLYCEEYGQDQLLVEALNSIGISSEDLMELMPLPETMAICNGLAYWASFDSLFYFSILGVLVNQNMKNFTSYLQVCERLKIDSEFLVPIRKLINNQSISKANNISRQIFQEFSHVDGQTKQRLKGQVYLFAQMYTNFYTAIFNYYSSSNTLLRRVSGI